MKFALYFLVALSACVLSALASAAQITLIPDPAFEQYLIDQNIDSDNTINGQVATSDVLAVTQLWLYGHNNPQITDITGLQDFTNLVELRFEDQENFYNTLDVSALTQLEHLGIGGSTVFGVDVSNNPNLKGFGATGSTCGNMDFSNNPLMEGINLYDAQAYNVTLGTHPNLKSFSMYYNGGGAGDQVSLDFSGSPLLEYLQVEDQVSLTHLDISTCANLKYLFLESVAVNAIDLSHCTSLNTVSIQGTPFYFETPLNALNLRNGNNAGLTSVNITGNPNLLCVEVDNGGDARADVGYYATWQHDSAVIFGDNCNLTYVPDDSFEQYIIDQGWDDVLNDYVFTDQISNRTSVHIQDGYITTYDVVDLTGLEDFASLVELRFEDQENFFNTLDVSALTQLEQLGIGGSTVFGVDVSNNPNLKGFGATGSTCGNMDFSNNPLMENINLYNAQAYNVTLGTHPNLKSLSMYYNGGGAGDQVSLDFSGSPLLEYLEVRDHVNLTHLDISTCTNLKYLFLEDVAVSAIDLSHCTSLNTVSIQGTPFYFETPLNTLDLRNGNNAGLTWVNIAGHPQLSCVLVDDATSASLDQGFYGSWTHDINQIFADVSCDQTYVPNDAFEQALIDQGLDYVLDDYVLTSSISGLTSLDLNGVTITDFTGLEAMASLVELRVTSGAGGYCSMSTALLMGLTTLEVLELQGVQLNDALVASNLPVLRECSVNIPNSFLELNFANCTQLQSLELGGDLITGVYLDGLSALEHFHYDFVLGDFEELDMTDSPLLKSFKATGHNFMRSIDLSNCLLLESFELVECGVDFTGIDLDFSNHPLLTTVSLFPTDMGSQLSRINSVDLRNGNNANLTTCRLASTAPLDCVFVDDGPSANADAGTYAGWEHQPAVFFATSDCGLTYVPDNNLEQALIWAGYDDVLDDFARTEQLETVEDFSLSSSVYDFTGMEAMTGLKHLSIFAAQTDLTPSLVANWPLMETIQTSTTGWSGFFDFSVMPNLTSLSVSNGDLNCSVASNVALETLSVAGGDNDLVIGSHPALTNFTFASYGTQASFDFSSCPSLEDVNIWYMPWAEQLNFTGCSQLKSVDLEDCATETGGIDLDFSDNPLLATLNLAGYTPPGGGAPQYLNRIVSLNLRNGGNQNLTNCQINSLQDLICVQVDDADAAEAGTGSYATWVSMPSATYSETCDLVYVPDDALEQQLIWDGVDTQLNDYVRREKLEAIEDLSLNSSIYDFTGMEAMTGLKHLSIFAAQTDLTPSLVANWPLMETIQTSTTGWSGFFDFSVMPNLTSLSVSNGDLNCSVASNVALETLSVAGGDNDLVIGSHPALTHFTFASYGTQASFDFSSCPVLENVNIWYMPWATQLNFSGCTNLNAVSMEDVGVNESGSGVDLDFSDCPNLTSLNLGGYTPPGGGPAEYLNKIKSINLQNGNNGVLLNCTLNSTVTMDCVAVDDAASATAGTGVYAGWEVAPGIAFTQEAPGCMDPVACNYNPNACSDAGGCVYPNGCTDVLACNYDSTATCDNGTCVYPAENDACANAAVLTSGVAVTGDLTNACFDAQPLSCGSGLTTQDVWYQYTSSTGQALTVFTTLNGTMNDSRLAVYDGCGGNLLYCNDNALSTASSITFTPTCGNTYYFVVTSNQPDDYGTFDIQLDEMPDTALCNDPLACNYSPCSTESTGCTYPGCINPQSCNYDANAGCDDGSCEGPQPIATSNCVFEANDDCTFDGLTICDNGLTNFSEPMSFDLELTGEAIVALTIELGYTTCSTSDLTVALDGTAFYTESRLNCLCEEPRTLAFDHSQIPVVSGTVHTLTFSWSGPVSLAAIFVDALSSDLRVDGCTDSNACNFDPMAACDDGSCQLPDGCTNPLACNFDGAALCDDGSCVLPDGCTDTLACNYNAAAICDDGSCVYGEDISYTESFCSDDFFNTGCTGNVPTSEGQAYNTEWQFFQYLEGAGEITSIVVTIDWTPAVGETADLLMAFDDQLVYVESVTGYDANFSSSHTISAESLLTQEVNGPDDFGMAIIGSGGGLSVSFYVARVSIQVNYQITANAALGCTNPDASNYDPLATCDDGSCATASICPADLDLDGSIGTGDLLVLLGVFGTDCADLNDCPVDLSGDGEIGTADLLTLLGVFATNCP